MSQEANSYSQIVEFYAPWCGHCQNLKPAYEKAARNLNGLAKVAAINCDEEENKPLCGQMGVQGFPTLKIVKPGPKKGKPLVEDYQGQRTTKAIVDAVVDKIPNHVKKLQDSTIDDWLADSKTSAKAILFTEKGTTSALIRSLAIDFLGSISMGQIRSKEQDSVDRFEIDQFPSVVLIPGEGQEHKVYTNQMNKAALTTFLSQVAEPNPDPAPQAAKPSKPAKESKGRKKSSAASSSFSKASEAHKASDMNDPVEASSIVLEDDIPTESPLPIVENEEKPMVVPEPAPAIPTLATAEQLVEACLQPKSGTCVLALLPQTAESDSALPEDALLALSSLAEIADKHNKRQAHNFPFFNVPAENERGSVIRGELGLKDVSTLEIIAINNKRGWWRLYEGSSYATRELENFVDAIRLGEGSKQRLPEGFDGSSAADSASAASDADAAQDNPAGVKDSEAEEEAVMHDEL